MPHRIALKLGALFLLWLFFHQASGHDTRMTNATLNFSKGKTTMNIRVFGDDLQNALIKHYKKEVNLTQFYKASFSDEVKKLIQVYINNHFQLTVNTRKISLAIISLEWAPASFKLGEPVLVINMSSNDQIASVKQIKIHNSLLNYIFDQYNFLHIHLNGKEETILTFQNGEEEAEVSF